MSDLRSLSASDASDRLSSFIDSLIESGQKVSPQISKVGYYILYACASDQALSSIRMCVHNNCVFILQQLLGASQNLLQSSVSVNGVSSVS